MEANFSSGGCNTEIRDEGYSSGEKSRFLFSCAFDYSW